MLNDMLQEEVYCRNSSKFRGKSRTPRKGEMDKSYGGGDKNHERKESMDISGLTERTKGNWKQMGV